MKLKSTKIWLLLVLLLILTSGFLYYSEEVKLLFSQPQKFFDQFIESSGLKKITLFSVLSGVSITASAFLIDLLLKGWKKSVIRKLFVAPTKSTKVDLWDWILTIFGLDKMVVLIFTGGIFYFLTSLTQRLDFLDIAEWIDISWLSTLIFLVVIDFKKYWVHRILHHSSVWPIHAFHHSAEEYTLINTHRGHFFEVGIHQVFDGIILIIFGASLEQYFIITAIKELYQYILHGNFNWRLGLIGKYLLISPYDHKIHHSKSNKHFNRNYGTLFIWWDKLFGTYYNNLQEEQINIGVKNSPINEDGYWKSQWNIARDIWKN